MGFDSVAERVLAKAIYPTAWSFEDSPYSPKSALEHTRAALRGLARAGFQVCRNRLGAGHAVPETAALLIALETIRDLSVDGDKHAEALKRARAVATKALESAS